MDSIHSFFEGLSPMMQGLAGSMFTWFVTALGASMVFFVKDLNRGFMDVLMGFTGGVMLAASFWSLLNPAIGMAESQGFGNLSWVPVGIGFLAGAFFAVAITFLLDQVTRELSEHQRLPFAALAIARQLFITRKSAQEGRPGTMNGVANRGQRF